MRAAWLCLVALATGCLPSVEVDAGELDGGFPDAGTMLDAGARDPGFDIPPEEWVYKGEGGAFGCYGRALDRFILKMETRDSSDAWCAYVAFHRQDGGFVPLFPSFVGPEDFQINDARWGLGCGGLDLPDGGLNPAARPVHDFYGTLELRGFYMNRPQAALVDAGIRVAYRVYSISQLAGLAATCPGP